MTTFRILGRNFAAPLTVPDLLFEVERYSAAALGGPDMAAVRATGPAWALWDMAEWLGCPVEIFDDQYRLVWWGELDELAIQVGILRVGLRLADVSNRVACAYSYVAPGSSGVGTRATTGWAQNDDSVGLYKQKELLVSLSGATQAQAEQARAAILEASALPVPTFDLGEAGTNGVSITCRGWFETLGWRYYAQSATTTLETSQQIANIVAAVGQFFTGVHIDTPSGVFSNQYRKGDTTGLFEVLELLKSGTINGRRLLATVSPQRELIIREEPERNVNNVAIYLQKDGRVADKWGNPVAGQMCPVGVWALLRDVLPSSLDLNRMADPSLFFVEQAEYNVASRRYLPRPRGAQTVWDITTKIMEG